jgi:hypothetical protein
MPDPTTEEAEWCREFELPGETEIRDQINLRVITNNEPKRQFAVRWLLAQDKARKVRDQQMYNNVRRTLWAAIAAVIVGLIGVAVTWFR